MAEQEYSGYGATGYVPITKWNYVPFYKKNVFTGAAQADQAANLITSESFKNFWSRGIVNPSGAEMVQGVRLNSPYGDAFNIKQWEGRTNYTTPDSGFKPNAKNIRMSSPDGVFSNGNGMRPSHTLWDLRNSRGAEVFEDRKALATLKYRQPAMGVQRYVSASGPEDLLGVSSELEKGTSRNYTSGVKPSKIVLRTGPYADARTASTQLLLTNESLFAERMAIADSENAKLLNKFGRPIALDRFGNPVEVGPVGALDEAPIVSDAKQRPYLLPADGNAERTVGTIKRDTVSGVQAGRPFVEEMPTTTTTVYGPPDKSAQWMARGKQALHIGGKALAVVGGALEVANVPDRVKGYYMNALKNDPNWRPDASDKFGMSLFAGLESSANFATMGFYDQRERIVRDATSGAGYGKGYYGTMVPRSGMTSVHQNPESRYDRQGVSFNHLYPQAPR